MNYYAEGRDQVLPPETVQIFSRPSIHLADSNTNEGKIDAISGTIEIMAKHSNHVRVVLSPPIPFLWAHSSHSGNYEFIVFIFFNLLGNVLVVRIRKKLFCHLPGMFICHIIGSYHMKKLFRCTKSSTVFSSV